MILTERRLGALSRFSSSSAILYQLRFPLLIHPLEVSFLRFTPQIDILFMQLTVASSSDQPRSLTFYRYVCPPTLIIQIKKNRCHVSCSVTSLVIKHTTLSLYCHSYRQYFNRNVLSIVVEKVCVDIRINTFCCLGAVKI